MSPNAKASGDVCIRAAASGDVRIRATARAVTEVGRTRIEQVGSTRIEARRYQIRGVVQGVGFRPFVFRTAERHALGGWIRNDSDGVVLEVQGRPEVLEEFIVEVRTRAPALARIESVALLEQRREERFVESFEIHVSERGSAQARTLVSPDTCVCEECLAELLDPADRRHRYPYINCTNCGPRYSIIRGVPYDREMTTMAAFPMCERCEREYHDVRDRRFHAQPTACWECGPKVALVYPGTNPSALSEVFGSGGPPSRAGANPPDAAPANLAGGAPANPPDAAPSPAPDRISGPPDPIEQAAELLREGAILAVKGLGGYHLMVDARSEEAVARLRRRKRREEKPFAVMSPTLEAVRRYALVQEPEARLLSSAQRPIVLVRKRSDGAAAELAAGIAPGNRSYGAMLAYTPVHHLLFEGGFDVLVATSGNVSDEPIAFRDGEALARLAGIADAFLVGEREIYTRVDDSIVRCVDLGSRPADRAAADPSPRPGAREEVPAERGETASASGKATPAPGKAAPARGETASASGKATPAHSDAAPARGEAAAARGVVTPIRRARGYTPEPVRAPFALPPLLAVGPELKNTICLTRGEELFLSHHIGDLKNEATMRSFEHAIEHLSRLLEVTPQAIAHDMHPGYLSTRFARAQQRLPTVAVQHHHAHMAACMCEHGLLEPVIGVIFDGTGYGTDGNIWGGEFLVGDYVGFERAAHLAYFRLPGGDRAVEEPYRAALSLLWEAYGEEFTELDLPVVGERSAEEREVLARMLQTGVRSPLSSSMGRLFDGVAALIGVRERCRYEAQAAIELEQLVRPGAVGRPFAWGLCGPEQWPWRIDPAPMVRELASEVVRRDTTAAELSLRFHCTVIDMVRGTCRAIRERTGIGQVVLSGGVFQNELLLRGCHAALGTAGFAVYCHNRVPGNDGGVALGQAAVAGWGALR
jgi:hydrogenase maturation protein HypF